MKQEELLKQVYDYVDSIKKPHFFIIIGWDLPGILGQSGGTSPLFRNGNKKTPCRGFSLGWWTEAGFAFG